jgi:hypothetical protein
MTDQQRSDSATFVVQPNGVYRPEDLSLSLGIPLSGIRRDIRSGKLRASKRRGRLFVLGEQVLDWLRAGEVRRRKTAGKNNGTAPPQQQPVKTDKRDG